VFTNAQPRQSRRGLLTTVSLLIVDDVIGNIRLIEALLAPDGHIMRTAENGADALRQIDLEPPDLVADGRRDAAVEQFAAAAKTEAKRA
jgi:DNA-binding NtrC family response regulator